MVWFQCEDCGESLKKPKLPNHFRICRATKFSCIDCGKAFGQDSVQGHTQCLTEAEKYGPKGQGKAPNGTTPKANKDAKKQPDIDINVGLSERPPWFCSLCNTKATSKQTLLLHADGKKHRAKARAFHAARQQPKQIEECAPDANAPSETAAQGTLSNGKHLEEQNFQDMFRVDSEPTNLEVENGKLLLKKRELDQGNDTIQVVGAKAEETESQLKKVKHDLPGNEYVVESVCTVEDHKKIKWKKLIKTILRSNPDGVLRIRKLKKLVLKSLQESGITEDEGRVSDTIEKKINASSRFRIDGKYIHLMAKD